MSLEFDSDAFTAALLNAYRNLDISTEADLRNVGAVAVEAAKRNASGSRLEPTIEATPVRRTRGGEEEHGKFIEIHAGDRRSRAFYARFREFGTVKSGARPFFRTALAEAAQRFGEKARW